MKNSYIVSKNFGSSGFSWNHICGCGAPLILILELAIHSSVLRVSSTG